MANVLMFATVLGASGYLALSSDKLSSSTASSNLARRRLPDLKCQKLNMASSFRSVSQRTGSSMSPSRRCQRVMCKAEDTETQDYYEKVWVTERNQLRDLITHSSKEIENLMKQLDLTNEQIKKLGGCIDYASKDLSAAVDDKKEKNPTEIKPMETPKSCGKKRKYSYFEQQ